MCIAPSLQPSYHRKMVPTLASGSSVSASHARLAELIKTKRAVIGVIGLGYVGLPLIRAFTRPAFGAWASTSIRSKVDKLKAGQSYIKHIDSVGARAR